MGEAEWVRFVIVRGDNLLKFELPLCIHGGDERRKKKSREERERGCREGGMGRDRKEQEKGVTRNG